MQEQRVVWANDLTKAYGPLVAVDHLHLEVWPGECFSLLGPNGAGKSSTIRMICCLSEPTAGELWVLGRQAHAGRRDIKEQLGVVAQEDYLDPDLTVQENLEVHGRFYGLGPREAHERAGELLEFLQLGTRAGDTVRSLSGGMRRRLVIARALMGRPQLLVLDEPTTGLDPQARLLVWEKIRQLQEEGVTVLLTTHYMEEAQRLATRVAVMDHGHILEQGSPQDVIARVVGRECLECPQLEEKARRSLARVSQEVPGTRWEERGDDLWVFTDDATSVLSRWRAHGVEPQRYTRRPATLEDVFLTLTGKELRE